MSRRILIVEDDERLRRELGRALDRRGHEVVEVDGLGALARDVDPVAVDWAIVDLSLGDGSGLDAVSRLCEAKPDLRVVVLTGYGSIASALEATRRGAVDYLTKPADVDQLLAALDPDASAGEGDDGAPRGEGGEAVPSLERVEWEHIQRVLHDCDGNITRAAKALGIHRRTLQRKLSYRPPSR